VSAADELEFYGLSVTAIPPHRPCRRIDRPDRVFATRVRRREALVAELAEQNALGRPVLVGTESIAESESLASDLRERGISCAVLNAKNDAREAEIVADAGRPGAVTISTNMAGRGTDIRLGGADERERAAVVGAGGLTLHQYSFTIEEQRRIILVWRETVLQGEAERFLEHACKERTARTIARLGADALHRIQDQIVLRTIDRCWSDHLEAISDIRRAIHLERYAGRPPSDTFLHQAAAAFDRLLEAIEVESIRVFETLEISADGAVDWQGAGLSAPSSTWTYTINDDLTESNLIRGLADNPAVMLFAAPMIPLLLVYGIWQRLRTRRV
jgi:preprotein translocase subunit SecA